MDKVKNTDVPQSMDAADRRRYEELEMTYRSAPVGLGLVDRDLRYVRVNDRLAEFIGRPREEILGRTLREVIPEAAPSVEPLYQQVIKTGEPVVGLEVSAATDAQPGVERHWLVSYAPLVANDDEEVAVSSIVQDVTERIDAEHALAVSEERFRAFMDNSPNYIYMKDADGRHIYGNRALLDLYGITLEEYRGTRTGDFFPPDLTETIEEGDRKCLQGSVQVHVMDFPAEADGRIN